MMMTKEVVLEMKRGVPLDDLPCAFGLMTMENMALMATTNTRAMCRKYQRGRIMTLRDNGSTCTNAWRKD
jgi:hypothetical protein